MQDLRRIGLGLGAALLLTASLPAAETAPPRDGARDTRQIQPDRSRGGFGFPDWDSRSGRYDPSRGTIPVMPTERPTAIAVGEPLQMRVSPRANPVASALQGLVVVQVARLPIVPANSRGQTTGAVRRQALRRGALRARKRCGACLSLTCARWRIAAIRVIRLGHRPEDPASARHRWHAAIGVGQVPVVRVAAVNHRSVPIRAAVTIGRWHAATSVAAVDNRLSAPNRTAVAASRPSVVPAGAVRPLSSMVGAVAASRPSVVLATAVVPLSMVGAVAANRPSVGTRAADMVTRLSVVVVTGHAVTQPSVAAVTVTVGTEAEPVTPSAAAVVRDRVSAIKVVPAADAAIPAWSHMGRGNPFGAGRGFRGAPSGRPGMRGQHGSSRGSFGPASFARFGGHSGPSMHGGQHGFSGWGSQFDRRGWDGGHRQPPMHAQVRSGAGNSLRSRVTSS